MSEIFTIMIVGKLIKRKQILKCIVDANDIGIAYRNDNKTISIMKFEYKLIYECTKLLYSN